jgi:hypothetical protein
MRPPYIEPFPYKERLTRLNLIFIIKVEKVSACSKKKEADMALCPICKQSDRIVPLSAVPKEVVSDSEEGRFLPPEAPRYPRIERIIGFSLAILLMSAGVLLFIVYDALTALFIIIAGFIFIACFINDEKERRGAWQEKVIEWQLATDIWESLYYCTRDETIFNPESNDIILFDNLNNYLYQSA